MSELELKEKCRLLRKELTKFYVEIVIPLQEENRELRTKNVLLSNQVDTFRETAARVNADNLKLRILLKEERNKKK